MSNFSSGVRIGGLDDFISPSQDCIKPIEKKAKKAAISLQDCLACSGCVTSAETVLIESQGPSKFWSSVDDAAYSHVVVSVSPEACASIALSWGLDEASAHKRLAAVFRSWGASRVYDIAFCRAIALLESRAELSAHLEREGPLEPLLCSSCPGWICYAEKRDGDAVLPLVSRVRSPQQIMGSFLKTHVAAEMGASPERIFHVAIMPCFDKKLEASRSDFYNDALRTRDVDLVLTASEVASMLEERSVELSSVEEDAGEVPFAVPHEREGSGGYAADLFRYAALKHWNVAVDEVPFVRKRNSDFLEAALTVDGKVVLRVAKTYGFRNIQYVIRSVKRGTNPYHYVEVMACPSGCLNGGGQIRVEAQEGVNMRQAQKDLLVAVQEAHARGGALFDAASDDVVASLYAEWVQGEPGSERAKALLHTEYRAVEPMTSDLAIQW